MVGKQNCKRNVVVDGRNFRSMKDLKNEIRRQIKNESIDQRFFLEILKHHPTKTSTLYDTKGRPRKIYVGMSIYKSPALMIEGDIEPISWTKCVKRIFAKDLDRENTKESYRLSIAAMRHQVFHGKGSAIKLFLESKSISDRSCEMCKVQDGEDGIQIDVDHYPIRFEDLVESFLQYKNMNHKDLGKMKKTNAAFDKTGVIHVFQSETFANEWQKWHDTKARFRFLCNGCNIRGNTGIKKRKRI